MPTKKAAKKPAAAKKAPAKKKAAARAKGADPTVGQAPVNAWIKGAKPQHATIARALDEIVSDEIPDITKAVKWGFLFWGREKQGWILRYASWKAHSSIRFYAGTSLTPLPPEGEPGQDVRGVRIDDGDDLDEKQVRAWLRQAAKLPGWGTVKP